VCDDEGGGGEEEEETEIEIEIEIEISFLEVITFQKHLSPPSSQ
jgi:hypothetical protein